MTYTPESLNLFDRFFNRHRKEVADRGTEVWKRTPSRGGILIESMASTYERDWVDYRVIDRLTGSVTIERDYLN